MANSSNTKRSSSFKSSDQTPFSSSHKRDLTVRDERGRQRFHGAFTGGFSAGYFNTVGSVEGFQPKRFISKRHESTTNCDEANSVASGKKPKFVHTPEDYMDEEDFSEFGIAPKRVRVNEDFDRKQVHEFAGLRGPQTSSEKTVTDALSDLIQPVNLSIGEILLKKMKYFAHKKKIDLSGACLSSMETSSDDGIIEEISYKIKNDRHGIGYKPLMAQALDSMISTKEAPLKAVLQGGQRIKISGEAFGVGALDDDEDYATFDTNIYGEDEMTNYDFGRSNESSHKKRVKSAKRDLAPCMPGMNDIISGFVRAKKNPFLEINSQLLHKYPPPVIPTNWQPPSIDVNPFVHQASSSSIDVSNRTTCSNLLRETFDSTYTNVTSHLKQNEDLHNRPLKGLLASKFVVSSEKSGLLDTGLKAGLTQYSDLEVTSKPDTLNESILLNEPIESCPQPPAKIVRKTSEWHPSNILCKRFNVPNPFPNSNIIGLLESGTPRQPSKMLKDAHHEIFVPEEGYGLDVSSQTYTPELEPLMPMDILKSIFDSPQEETNNFCDIADTVGGLETISEENECEIIVSPKRECKSRDFLQSDVLPEVEIVAVARRSEPVVVSILSSSDESSDEYGPSLPPNLCVVVSDEVKYDRNIKREQTKSSVSSNGDGSDKDNSKRSRKKSKKKKSKKDNRDKRKKHKKHDR